MKDSVASARFLVGVAWSLSRRDALVAFLEVLGLVVQRLMPLWIGLIIGAVGTQRTAWAWGGAVGIAMSMGAAGLFVVWGVNSRLRMLDLVGHELDGRLALAMASTPTVSNFGEPVVLETLQIIRDRLGALGGAYNSLVNALNGAIPPIVSVGTAIAIDPKLGLLAVVAMLSLAHAWISARWEERAEEVSAEHGVQSDAWADVVLGAAADELRSYGALKWASHRTIDATRRWRDQLARAEFRSNALGVMYDVVYAVTASLIIWWVLLSHHGWQAAALLTAALLVAADLREGFVGLRGSLEAFAQGLRTVGRFRRALYVLQQNVADQHPVPTSAGIKLEAVSVTYAGNDEPSLREVTVTIPPGSVVAVVGENGAGKSTFAKTLLGLHEPSGGRILAGDSLLDAGAMRHWRSNASGVFQDYERFGFSVQTSVGIGKLVPAVDGSHQPSSGAVVDRAIQRADAWQLVQDLPDGLARILHRAVARGGDRHPVWSGGNCVVWV